jgi:hypothetical protein
MKKFILGVALAACVAACKTETNQAPADATQPKVENKADCCSGSGAAACEGQKKADCGKTCPVTGEKMN